MQFCIYGAGATGGHFAVRLARAGHEVSLIARGTHLAAIREDGLRLQSGGDMMTAKPVATDDPRALGVQEVVIVATKATALPSIATQIGPLIGKDTLVIFAQNGMTWWYPTGLSTRHPRPPAIPIFDLGTPFLAAMRPDQVLGGIIYSANEVVSPGVIKNNSPDHNRLEFADISGIVSDRISAVRSALECAGIRSPDPGDIRAALWTKLVNNMSGSAIGVATRSTSDGAREDPALSEIYRRVVREGLAVAAAHGYPLDDKLDPDLMLARLLKHKASMLQDYEQGRPMEVAEIVLAPIAFARAMNVATPTLDALGAIVTKLAKDRRLI